MLIQDLDCQVLDNTDQYKSRRQAIVQYVLRTFRSHNPYIYKFLLCEILNLVNVLFQVYTDIRKIVSNSM